VSRESWIGFRNKATDAGIWKNQNESTFPPRPPPPPRWLVQMNDFILMLLISIFSASPPSSVQIASFLELITLSKTGSVLSWLVKEALASWIRKFRAGLPNPNCWLVCCVCVLVGRGHPVGSVSCQSPSADCLTLYFSPNVSLNMWTVEFLSFGQIRPEHSYHPRFHPPSVGSES